jgi:hypothetical protein
MHMNNSSRCLAGSINIRSSRIWLTLTVAVLALSGCGGGADTVTNDEQALAQCLPSDPATFSECGTVYVGLTDADGDFLSYSVDVLSLTLEKANGATVETIPNSTRIDFSDYVNLTELMSVATVPPGTYVAGTITLDYSTAEVFIDSAGAAKTATVVDANGNTLAQMTSRIVLPESGRLFVTRGQVSLLTVDFDLEASHTVDAVPTPARATAEPFIVAVIDPVDGKEIRVRGRLIDINQAEMWYAVTVRPFHDRAGAFGRMQVSITDETEFEVDGELFRGSAGLRALNAAGEGTITVAQGVLNASDREFTANIVLAGSSVPGTGFDAVKGNVVARNGNDLVVRGGTVIMRDTSAFFRDDIVVTVGPDTRVSRTTHDRLLDISAVSVGQAVTIYGEVIANDELGIHLDATEGALRMHVTHLGGMMNTIVPGQVDITLHSIDGRRAQVFDFTGTGISPDQDADPDNYEISTGDVLMTTDSTGRPVMIRGFPNAFGVAPPDFEGRTIIDYSDVVSSLGVGWGIEGSAAPFLSMGGDGLLLDNQNPDIGQRHYIKQGPVLIDLTMLDSGTLIAPRETDRRLFSIASNDSLRLYADFDDFIDALTLALDGATTARSMYARGNYDADDNVFTAHRIGVYLLEPRL